MNVTYKYKNLIKDTVVFALGSIGSKLILFLMVPLYTNYMTTGEFGISDLILTLSELIVPFTSLVIFDAVQRFALANDESPEDVLCSGIFVTIIGSILTVIITPIFSYYSAIAKYRWYLSMYIILTMLGNTEKNYLKARDKNKLFAILSVLQTFVLAINNLITLVYLHLGIYGYLFSMCIASTVPVLGSLAFGGLFEDLRNSKFDIKLTTRMIRYSIPLILNNASWWAIHSFDKIIIEMWIGVEALGIYSVATKMPSLINVLTSIFGQAWTISATKEYENDNDKSYYLSVITSIRLLVMIISIIVIGCIQQFMIIYVGENFISSWRYVPLLLVAASLYSIGSLYGAMYSATKSSINAMGTTLLSALTCVILTILLIPIIGIWGAVFGNLASYIVLSVVRSVNVTRILDINFVSLKDIMAYAILIIDAIFISYTNISPFLVTIIALMSIIAFEYKGLTAIIRKFRI